MDCVKGISFILGYMYLLIGQSFAKEYCLRNTFSPKCPQGEVIVMTVAKFGRMKVGKCVQEDLGFKGCYDDVLHILDEACSGRNECHYPIDELEKESTVCPRSLKSFLEAEYNCLQVVSMKRTECQNMRQRTLPSKNGFISSHVARESGCGSINMPWKLEVDPGQRINVTIIYFNNNKKHQSSRGCRSLGYIFEIGHRSNTSICSTRHREEHIYESNGRSIQIGINTKQDVGGDFLLQYKVFGCPDFDILPKAWYKRQGDIATVGCEGTDILWNIECINSQWMGHVGNCSADEGPKTAQVSSKWLENKTDFTTIILVIIGGGFMVLLIICVTLIIIKFRRSNPVPPSSNTIMRKDYNVSHPIYDPSDESNHYKSLKSRGSNPSRPVSYTVPRHVQDQEAFNTQFRPSSHVFSSTLPRNTPALPFPPDTKYEDESDASPGEVQGNYNAPNYFILDQNYINN